MRWLLDAEFKNKYINKVKGSKENIADLKICPRKLIGFKSGEGLDLCIAGHAERNTLINAARSGVCTKDAILYMSCNIPCSACLIEIINAGIKEIVVTSLSTYDDSALYLLNRSTLEVRLFDFIK
jgi:dCMP deaminase